MPSISSWWSTIALKLPESRLSQVHHGKFNLNSLHDPWSYPRLPLFWEYMVSIIELMGCEVFYNIDICTRKVCDQVSLMILPWCLDRRSKQTDNTMHMLSYVTLIPMRTPNQWPVNAINTVNFWKVQVMLRNWTLFPYLSTLLYMLWVMLPLIGMSLWCTSISWENALCINVFIIENISHCFQNIFIAIFHFTFGSNNSNMTALSVHFNAQHVEFYRL